MLSPTLAASDRTVVAVAHDGEKTALVSRIEAELEALGYEVKSIALAPREAANDHEDLSSAAGEAGAIAAIRVTTTGDRVGVWLADLAAGRITLREVAVEIGQEEDRESAVALEAVELLRVSLLDLAPAPAPKIDRPPAYVPISPEATPSAPPSTTAPARPDRFFLELGPQVTAAGFDSGPAVNLLAGASLRLWRVLRAQIVGVVPMVPSLVEGDEGAARVHFAMVGAGAFAAFGSARARWRPDVGLGFGAVFLPMEAHAKDGYTDREELVIAASPYLRAGVSLWLAGPLRIALLAIAGWAFSSAVVRFDGREVARFVQPWLGGALALELSVW